MQIGAWLKATLAAFVVIFGVEFAVHHVWLGEFYKAHAEWWRPEAEMQSKLPLLFVSQLLMAALLTVVYAKGYQPGRGNLGQGFRFGVLIGLLLTLPMSLMQHVLYPYPASLILAWLGAGLIEVALAGAAIGAFYKPAD